MQIYYQVELDANGVVVAIHSSDQPFNERQVTLEQIKTIRVGETKWKGE